MGSSLIGCSKDAPSKQEISSALQVSTGSSQVVASIAEEVEADPAVQDGAKLLSTEIEWTGERGGAAGMTDAARAASLLQVPSVPANPD